MTRQLLAVALLLAPVDALCASTQGGPACPSFADLAQRLEAKVQAVLALKPGVPLKEFEKHAPRALNFWDAVGRDKETVFSVGVTEGNADMSDELVCVFDSAERL